jgi:predicted RNA-binding protein YlqC (UPF0109 family)
LHALAVASDHFGRDGKWIKAVRAMIGRMLP